MRCGSPPQRAVARNAALSGFAFRSNAKPLLIKQGRGQKVSHPPKVKITLTVVSTSTGSLLSR
jgi:hypothetical protein